MKMVKAVEKKLASKGMVAPPRLTATSPFLADVPDDPLTVLIFGSAANALKFVAKFEVVN